MPIEDTDPENYKRPRWDPSLLEDEDSDDDIVDDDSDDGEDGDDDIVDDSSDDGDSEEDEDFSSSSDDEESRSERNQRLRTETADLRAERIAWQALRQEENALTDQIRQHIRRIDARTEYLREERERDLQLLADISENARAEALEDRALGMPEDLWVPVLFGGHNLPPLGSTDLPRSAAPPGMTGLEDSDVQTAGDHPLDLRIKKVSVNQADISTDHTAELSTSKRTDDIVI